MTSLQKRILESLISTPNQLARELAEVLDVPKKNLNQELHSMEGISQDSEFRWSINNESGIEVEPTEHANQLDTIEAMSNLAEPLQEEDKPKLTDTKFSYDSLESIRKRLLDLTNRNSLLNYKHPKGGCIRLIDELPDQIYRHLLDGKKFTFIPVPEPTEKQLIDAGYITIDKTTLKKSASEYPTAEQWAKKIGLITSYDLPLEQSNSDSRHQDSNLQTLFYGPELEVRLRNIRGKAESSIEESGANILYLAMGFLEWYESRDSDLPRLSPLFTLPVLLEKSDLDRSAGAYRYTIQLKDDNLISNVTLREKLSQDFDLILPPIEDDSTPEIYFEFIKQTILQYQPRWKLRRQASLVLLNFSKQAMYQDLDPSSWPQNAKIDDHPLVRLFFSSQAEQVESSGFTYEEEHAIDEINNVHEHYPLIYDADSSQHSAIIDVVQGQSLVIEGPPGSGKSQTITNLIAACLANNQSVLFVAEKMAALNVVKSRLDNANLGDFCLELHSHKTNKKKILNDLSTRLANQPSYLSPQEIDADIERYESLKTKLNSYSLKVNSVYESTGSTIHEILHKTVRLRDQYSVNPENLTIDGLTPKTATRLRQNELSDYAHMLGSIFIQVSEQAPEGNIKNHYWYGIENTNIDNHEIEKIIIELKSWNESLLALQEAWSTSMVGFGINNPVMDFESIENFCEDSEKLPVLIGGEPLDQIDIISERHSSIQIWLDNYEKLHKIISELQESIQNESILQENVPETISDIRVALKSKGVGERYSLADLNKDTKNVFSTIELTHKIEESLTPILPHVPHELKSLFDKSEDSFKELLKFINLTSALPATSWKYRSEIFDNDELDGLLEQLTAKLKTITPIYGRLKDSVILEKLPSSQTLRNYDSILTNAGILKWFSKDWRLARQSVLRLSKLTKPNKKEFLSKLSDIILYAEEEEHLLNLNEENPILGDSFQGIQTPVDRIIQLRNWYKDVRKEYGVGFGERVKIGSYLLSAEKEFPLKLFDESEKGLKANITELMKQLAPIQSQFINLPLSKNSSSKLIGAEGELERFWRSISGIKQKASEIFKVEEITLAEMSALAIKLEGLKIEANNWNSSDFVGLIKPYNEALEIEPSKFSATNLGLVKNTLAITHVLSRNPLLLTALLNAPTPSRYQTIQDFGKSIEILLDQEEGKYKDFQKSGLVKEDDWFANCDGTVVSTQFRNTVALNHVSWLPTWIEYIRLRSKLYGQGFKNFIHVLEASEMQPKNLQDIVNLVINYQLTKSILEENPELMNFTGLEQNATQQRFKEYDARILKLIRKKVAFKASRAKPPAGISSGKVGEYTETYLIRHELNKTSRHIAVRELMKRSGNAIQKLKPCFMMSPMSVAQYLEPGRFNFDLVVMDEASQIRPEDALGAIARGSRIVVVGDPKQLPPTSFFSKSVDEEDEDEMVGLEDSESILESVMPMFKSRRLRWHYRSKHESLIAFSNKHFYDDNLILFPSPFKFSSDFGIKNHPVPRGRFVTGRNVEEAQEVVKSIANHLLNHPEESIGIVAMNVQQRDEIEKQLEQFIKDNPSLIPAYDSNKSSLEPIFIKNLENVQGDERDVIYISMTYGPEQVGGRIMQRFGPINSDVGWRRLNVLFTRSKKRMHIFTSMSSGDIKPASASSRGVLALKAFLEYAETGHLHHSIETSKTPDSDFEIAVINQLSKFGYECEPQLGVAGFFLDIAVRDPGKPGRFLMGIECDGATYHSAKSARDRDHLRQEILESLGWKIRRIWSTDWFKHPDAQIQPILTELERLRTPVFEGVTAGKMPTDEDHFTESVLSAGQTEMLQQLGELSILDRLREFDNSIIKSEFPKTPEEQRLLRQEMVDILLETLPTSTAEFREKVPAYIRTGTATYEAKFLESVLSIIADYA